MPELLAISTITGFSYVDNPYRRWSIAPGQSDTLKNYEKEIPMLMARIACGVSLAVVCTTSNVWAGYTIATAPTPGGYAQAGAAPSTPGSNPGSGGDILPIYVSGNTQEQAFTGNSSASASASYSSGNTSNSAQATVGLGILHMQAQNNAPNNSFFAGAAVNGGWNDTFNISNPSLNGQSGFMVFTVHVTGYLEATGFAGSANFSTTAFKNGSQLMYHPLFSPGNSDLLSTDRQYGNWSIATDGIPNFASKSVDGIVTFAVPITFGTQFTLGVTATARAGMRSSSGVAGNSTAITDFSSTLNWNGISAILDANQQPVTGSTINSGSGIDWSGVIIPEPTTALLLLAAAPLLTARRRAA